MNIEEGVNRVRENYALIKSGDGMLSIYQQEEQHSVKLMLAYGPEGRQRQLIFGAGKIVHDPAAVGTLKLTPEQVEKLKALDLPRLKVLRGSERAEVLAKWKEYEKARAGVEQNRAERVLMEMIDQRVGPAMTRETLASKAEAIRGILTAGQWEQLSRMGP